jgi:sensor c-di-GMP phosphodiesterase-like protein
VFERLRQLGVRLAIDDFGTGYSSLNYLTTYPITRLKIAQELVSQVVTDHRNAVVVRAAVALAHELRIEVIAEGVETAAHSSFLVECDCNQAQGYHFSRPLAVAPATDLLRQLPRQWACGSHHTHADPRIQIAASEVKEQWFLQPIPPDPDAELDFTQPQAALSLPFN